MVNVTEVRSRPIVDRQERRDELHYEYVLAATAHTIERLWLNGQADMKLVVS